MTKDLVGRLILSAVAIFTAVMPYLADWNGTHIFNPRWTPHAKFHNAQTMAFAALLGGVTLFYAWRTRAGIRERRDAATAGIFASLYWATQGLAHFYPGVAYIDPEFVATARLQPVFGMTPQGLIDIAILAITTLGVVVARSSFPPKTRKE